MKIEMGESLGASWLKHVRNCFVVQTNWKTSKSWPKLHLQEINGITKGVARLFKERYNAQIFKQNKSFEQLEKQAECDMIGISRGKRERVVYHALEVAVHTRQGLEYTGIRAGKKANVSDDKVVAKLFNAAMALYANIDVTSGEVLFLTPYVKPQLLKRIETRLRDLADYLHHIELGAGRHFDFEFKIIANDAFTEKVMNPILEIGDDVADTSELFVRAMQIFKLASVLRPWERGGRLGAKRERVVVDDEGDVRRAPHVEQERRENQVETELILTPRGHREFAEALCRVHRARRVRRYADGRVMEDVWTTRLNESARVLPNIYGASYWKKRHETGLLRVEIAVIE